MIMAYLFFNKINNDCVNTRSYHSIMYKKKRILLLLAFINIITRECSIRFVQNIDYVIARY